ncbi:ATP-binding protein [Pseudothauera rhizosphaerae]|uniref:ATP-binding protein n=1 Tax=Pseudothauera rhizosphaerae TaxID=2565932 RepID=UPI001454DD5D|nr:ATP-binding protein [Pseudothauera rhizosphaerae]
MSTDFEQTLSTDLGAIPALADAFAEWAEEAGVAAGTVFQVNLALEELITNVILHGLGPGAPGRISLRVRRQDDVLEMELRDDAPPFDPFQLPPPVLTQGIEEREVGGLGVHFVRTLMDEWHYAREDGHNLVRLRKVLEAAP